MDFGRLITAMVTPFDEQNRIHWGETARLIDYLIEEQKSDSLVVCGTTGESPTLTDEEKLELFRFTVEHVAGRCKVIAGTGSNNTAHTIELSKEAEKLGVDGLLLVAPYYNKPSQEGLYQHFSAIANSVSLPAVLYNIPGRTGISISAETTLRLAQIPNIVATKECAPLDQVAEIASGAPAGFIVYSGDDAAALPALAVGAYGVVSVASHIVGSPMKEMITGFLAGQVEEAAKLHQRLLPVFKGLFECPNPVAVKYALNLRGYLVGSVRLPLIPPTEAEAERIRELLN
ncbi:MULTISPECIES: 4-hydroxy-tetrahydrodipicolinate synthase [unclassified Paenibacillus]|uniref:4-hydroxy-tetrahydrodipicolinate synthase n=1 Tax=unclassified Paenibacillus TaxID=185978 RepID=UPI0008390870|nr:MULTISPECIES: 4-hydroxy-tetrahydrodipicolinate synthase [unclassified Paenibacillus]NWL86448.1 4-hydroxy-tetrahydrodipicolinate synthase [Paenibacillus sp. 79R4]